MAWAVYDLNFNISKRNLAAVFEGCAQTLGHCLLTHHSGATCYIAKGAHASNMIGVGMSIYGYL